MIYRKVLQGIIHFVFWKIVGTLNNFVVNNNYLQTDYTA